MDAANRLLEDDSFLYVYDDNGNLASKTEKATSALTTYTYDAQDQLVRIDLPGGGIAEYAYDALGRRIQKTVDGVVTKYLYDGSDIVLEFDGNDNLAARYSHGLGTDQPLALTRGGQDYYYQANHQGSAVLLSDAAGLVVNAYDYDAFGNFDARVETVANPYGFTGREYDPESGLYYYRARYYDPKAGRFIQEDPLGFAAGDANFYAYVFNDPVNLTDPSGLVAFTDYGIASCFASAFGDATGSFYGGIFGSIATSVANAVATQTQPDVGEILDDAVAAGTTAAAIGGGISLATCGAPRVRLPVRSVGSAVVKAARKFWRDQSGALRIGGARLIPLGFEDALAFSRFAAHLSSGLRSIGFQGARGFFQGSSVTGRNAETGAAFDAGRISDFDIAIAGDDIFAAAKAAGLPLRSKGTRTGPLDQKALDALGLSNLAKELSQLAGRPVNFMIFQSSSGATVRSTSISIP